ncbi:hypothetical protein [Microcystis phage MJing1]|nr:hypothetical protein [Microcystis phage MJing1]
MSVNDPWIWNALSLFVVAPLAWFLKGSLDRLTAMEVALRLTRETLFRDYATKVEMSGENNRLLDRFDNLEAKLDRILLERHQINPQKRTD